ncbi:DUF3291 domain-containing protein [Spirosoma soli]|uniref:DUF3291 domain-containing protein n=1 Tax=Spirosoma soli TaxID=1770529 RepID=A0ABW5M6E1_9BACT
MSSPVVTVTAFQYQPSARFRAFANMGRFLMQPIQAEGLRFSKLMGSGRDYGLIPDFSTYVHLGVWGNETEAKAFTETTGYRRLQLGAREVSTLLLRPERAHGLWDGQNPFSQDEPPTYSGTQLPNGPVAVLTRATIRPRALPDFWRHVPQARQRLQDQRDNLLFGIGVGEVPVVQQCTISVWRDPAAIDRYAYRQSGHKEIVRLTRQRRWYSEELFARFSVLNADGPLFSKVANQLAHNTSC